MDIGMPSESIWQAVNHPARTPMQKEIYFKFLYNALPLATRTASWSNSSTHCFACPETDQTLQHFIHDCTLAQTAWKFVQQKLSLQIIINPQETAFSFPTITQAASADHNEVHRVHTIHAVVLSVLWTAHTTATYQKTTIPPTAIPSLICTALTQHLAAKRAQARTHKQLEKFHNLWDNIIFYKNNRKIALKITM
jgi:hypothetical protein